MKDVHFVSLYAFCLKSIVYVSLQHFELDISKNLNLPTVCLMTKITVYLFYNFLLEKNEISSIANLLSLLYANHFSLLGVNTFSFL